jgi:tetratricopeptide (TPR) repeat protein
LRNPTLASTQAPQKEQNRSPRTSTRPAVNFERLKAKAEAARDADQVSEAIKSYTQLVQIRPRWSEGWWYLGTLHYDSDQYAPGVKAFQQFVAIEPKNGQGWAMLGLCEYQIKQYVSALQHLAKGRSLGLSGNEELGRVVRYHQAVLLTRGKQYEAAITLLNGFAVEHRESDAVLDAMGLAMLRISDPIETLTSEQREMVRKFGKASYLGAERKMPESNKMFQELEAHYWGQPNVAYAYGVGLLQQKEPEKAMTYFLKELERDPRHVAALLQVAFQSIASGKYTDGLPYAKKAAEIEPDNFAAYYALGRIYVELDDIAQALKNLEKAAAIAPDSSNVQFVLARAYTRAKRPAEAARARAEFSRLEALAKKRRGEATGPGDPSETTDDEGNTSNP